MAMRYGRRGMQQMEAPGVGEVLDCAAENSSHGDEEDDGDGDGGDCYHDRDRQAESNHKKQLH